MFEKLKKAYHYISEGVWTKERHEYNSKFMRWFSGQIQVFVFTIRSFGQNQMVVRSAGLTYYTLLAIVPLVAVIFGVLKGFGYEDRIEVYLERVLPHFGQLSGQITDWARNMFTETRGGWIAAIGLVIFLWSVIRVFMSIEDSFNYIWEVRRRKRQPLLNVLYAPIFYSVKQFSSEHFSENTPPGCNFIGKPGVSRNIPLNSRYNMSCCVIIKKRFFCFRSRCCGANGFGGKNGKRPYDDRRRVHIQRRNALGYLP